MTMRALVVSLAVMITAGARAESPQSAAPPAQAAPVPNCPELAAALGRVTANDARLRDSDEAANADSISS